MSNIRRGLLAVLCCALGVACANDAHFDVRYATGFDRRAATVSVFGVLKNGTLSPEAWDEIGRRLSPALGKEACEIAYRASFKRSNQALAAAIEEATAANGISDPLLDAFAPLAEGDAILSIVMTGGRSEKLDHEASPTSSPNQPFANPQSASPPSVRGGGGRGGRGLGSSGMAPHAHAPSREAIDLSASIYSVRLHRAVGLISMTYSGAEPEEAIEQFQQKLRKELPSATCTGWKRDVVVDAKAVRRAADEPISEGP